jgi:hypothetical protein
MSAADRQLGAVASLRRTARAISRRLGLMRTPSSYQPAVLSLRAAAVIFLLSIGLAYLLVGVWFMVVTAALAVVTIRFNPDPGRPFAFATFALVAAAMLVTIARPVELQGGGLSFELPQPGDPTIVFAKVREFAGQLGSYAGVFLAIATMMYAVAERTPRPGTQRQPWLAPRLTAARTALMAVPAAARKAAPFAAVGVVAVAVRVALAPAPIAPSLDGLIRNLRMGTSYSAVAGSTVPDGVDAPLAPVIGAFAPFGPRLVAVVLSLGVVALAGWCAQRWGGRPAAIAAALVAAVMPAVWDQRLSGIAAAAGVLAAVCLLGDDTERPGLLGRTATAGVSCGLAGLARPDAFVAVLVLAVWVLLGSGPRRGVRAAMVVVVAAVTMSPWLNFVWSEFGVGLPAAELGAALRDPSAASRLPGTASAVLLGVLALALVVRAGLQSRSKELLPLLALPAWCGLAALVTLKPSDLWSWSAPLLAVLCGVAAAELVHGRWSLAGRAAPVVLQRRAPGAAEVHG